MILAKSASQTTPNKSTTKTGTKRHNASKDGPQSGTAKTKKVRLMNPKITCDECLDDWGRDIKLRYNEEPDHSSAPDPRQKIETFTSFAAYSRHLVDTHDLKSGEITEVYCYLNSDFVCNSCGCSFESQRILDDHIEFEHAILDMTNLEFYDLYLKYLLKRQGPSTGDRSILALFDRQPWIRLDYPNFHVHSSE